MGIDTKTINCDTVAGSVLNMFNNDYTSEWLLAETTTSTSTLILDFGECHKFHSTILTFALKTGGDANNSCHLLFEYSKNKTDWTQISDDTTTGATQDDSYDSYLLDTNYRYLRIIFYATAGTNSKYFHGRQLMLVT